MPRRRSHYKPDESAALAKIEARRVAAEVSQVMLAVEAGLSLRTLQRAMKSGRAFKRHVNALAMAMRSFERELPTNDGAFPAGDGQ